MPKLWNETIQSHRREVRDAILETTIALVEERGLLSVTMSEIAERTGIGRATLYKYFPDVEAILQEWHERQIEAHLDQLAEIRHGPGGPGDRVVAVFDAFALIARESQAHHDTELGAILHRGHEELEPEARLLKLLTELLEEAAAAGEVRKDVEPEELAAYSLHALSGARAMRTKAAVKRLVDVTLDALRP